MNALSVGDRVEKVAPPHIRGTVVEVKNGHLAYIRFDAPETRHRPATTPMGNLCHWVTVANTEVWRKADPAPKATPKVGDVVRVVLEGKVKEDQFHHVEDSFVIGARPSGNLIERTADHVKSIEIIETGRSRLADLPDQTVIRNRGTGEVLVRDANWNLWRGTDGGRYTTAEVELMYEDWAVLTESSDEE